MRKLFIVFFLLLIQRGYCQKIDRHMDSTYMPIFNYRYYKPDYLVIYNRVKGIRLRITQKTLDEGNDWRLRIKLSNRVRINFDFIFADFNPDNFFYSGGIGIKFF